MVERGSAFAGMRCRATAIAAILFLAAACALSAARADAGVSALTARGSAEQVQVTGATPGAKVKLLRDGERVAVRSGGELGGVVFRKVEPGRGYAVRSEGTTTAPFRVFSTKPKPPDESVYDQTLDSGYGYLTTRDGTKLAINVHLPSGPGPFPTVVEYSGYGYARPGAPESGIQPVAETLGYAVVDVNMRGTGCSGGAFDYFEPLQSLDGYDVVETVARQDWVAGGKVGMMGISYGGISQLFVAATRPPHLAAITPLSVIDNTTTTLYPGGILNTGFALEWAQDRVDDSQPAGPDSGQSWAWDRIQGGDGTCAANQDLHPEATNLLDKTFRNRYYRPRIADPLSPVKFVDKIDVPVFMACQWTDEQTGGHCPTLASAMTGTRKKWFTFTNGVHVDSLDPATFNRWYDFLQIYVAKQKPELSPSVKALAPLLFQAFTGVPGVTLPDDPIQQQPDLAAAKAAFEAQKPIRILYDNGAGETPYKPVPGFERSYRSFPPPRMEARSWYFGDDGKLGRHPGRGADEFTWDPDARAPTSFSGNTGSGTNGLWTDSPSYDWTQNPDGTALSYVSRRLSADTTVLGAGEVQVWVRSQAENVDLQATVTEVRPDGRETFVQGGWLRTDARKIDRAESRLTEPQPTFRKRDAKTLPKGRWVKVRIPLYYEGHVYREGSRVRVIVSAPGGDQPIWAFADAAPDDTPWVAVSHSAKHASRLVLPVIPGGAPTELPACPALRGQPCRDYQELENRRFG
ncbi:MAG: CocE/NonD family hydrolase [Solirubrobacterales bacterium]